MTNDTNKIKRSEIQKSRSQAPLLRMLVVEPGILRVGVAPEELSIIRSDVDLTPAKKN